MDDLTDMELLRRYARENCDQAFATLVARHVSLVYSAACRKTSNPADAEEITQAVFVILAQKAGKLSPNTILPGWLYQTARLTASSFLRGEARRRRREQEASMQSDMGAEAPDETWQQLGPLLEDAMGELREKERAAIVLRFFGGHSFAEVAAAANISENAAKKRVGHGLEKLHRYFSKRGVRSTTAIIAGSISTNCIQPAPMALAKSITAVAVTKGAAATGSTVALIQGALKIMAWTKIKTAAAVGTIILLAAGATTVVVGKMMHHQTAAGAGAIIRVDANGGMTYTPALTRLNSQPVSAPPGVFITPAKANSTAGGGFGGSSMTGGKRMMVGFNASVASLLATAYATTEARIFAATPFPAEHYDYTVNVPDNPQAALQTGIKEKFGLVAKTEMHDSPVLLLKVVNPSAPGLKPSAASESSLSSIGRGRYASKNQAITALTRFLEARLRVPVLDQTGLTDHYDIQLHWDTTQGADPVNKSLKQSILDQLGLELVPDTQSIEMLTVSKAE